MSEDSPDYGSRQNFSDIDLVPQMVTSWQVIKQRMEDLQNFVAEVMREGLHYGPPYDGSTKKKLYKPGAELLAEIYAYTVVPRITHRIEQWTAAQGGPFFQYEFEADVISKRTAQIVGKGFGSCNSLENRYRWRHGARLCPACKGEFIIKGKEEYGGGWVCFKKKGGCGEKYADDDESITEQKVGRLENDDVCTLVNTILQVAKKRWFVAAVIAVTQSSGLFESGEDDGNDGAGDEQSGQRSGGTRGSNRRGNGNAQRSAGPGNGQSRSGDKPPDDKHPTKVVIRGETHWTAGVEFKALMRVWDLSKGYDQRFGKDSHRKYMQALVGVGSSHDLNAEMAERVIAGLQAELDKAGDPPPAAGDDSTPPYES